MAASASCVLFGILALLAHSLVESIHPVPVFIWSKESDLNGASPVLAGHTIKEKDFQDTYLDKLFQIPQTICLFLQDRLSIDDISHYGGAYSPASHGAAFSNLKFAMETANSTAVLPSVEISSSDGKPSELVDYIRKMADGLIVELNEEELKSFNMQMYLVDAKKTNVFIFHLHQTSSSSPMTVFTQNDELIGGITHQIATAGLSYTCILTAVLPSKAVHEKQVAEERSAMVHDRLRRDADDMETVGDGQQRLSSGGPAFLNGKCILMYFKELTFSYKNVSFDPLKSEGSEAAVISSDCLSNGSRSITVEVKNISNVSTFTFSMVFDQSKSGHWKCTNATVDVNGNFHEKQVQGKFWYECGKEISGPTKYSYSCSQLVLTKKVDQTSLVFTQFQVQAFNAKDDSFSYAYDCAGFFTIPILMGLITTGILLIILFIGVLALFSLTTMDRFDDPKGPTIQVATG